ncbi:hypothetical protein [Sphingobium fuliginis]|uniref:Uncharacterized protein n=1 Tax=Sphingobium fuliginis ATCC 27551 TaxID=1208342 RepID=A0A5B8CIV5_SPHSA|nr:hypothetical protein [Sphingobium fuliginis]QDC38692.1 hypothetical protein FIL70_17015 [Sphingobium fuliginis ATCC 27551]
MAKVDLSKFIDNSLKAEFEAKPYDISKDRSKLTARLEAALAQFTSNGNVKGPKLWKAKNGVVEFKAAVNGVDLTINGSTTNYIPESQFEPFLNALIEATNEGAFDTVFAAGAAAPAKTSGASKQKRNVSEASRLNIRVGGFRRGGKTDAEIRKQLTREGVDKAAIEAAIAYKRPGR